MTAELKAEVQTLAPAWEEIFRTLHRHPELGRAEYETAALIRRRLTELGIPHIPIADTGTAAVIQGAQPGRTLAFRADIDALPIQEDTGLPYASQTPNVMHACGHDLHTAALLGAAELLWKHRDRLHGTVKLFFQPDEEGDGGASRMIAEGCMENPPVDAMLCCHVDSTIPTGTLATKPGPICAASNPFTVILHGCGSHGAKPHLGTDVIAAGAQIITALQTITSRRVSPTDPVVVTVGSFHAGDAGNVLPEEARFSGMIRTMSAATREKVKLDFETIVTHTAAAMGVKAKIRMTDGYPCCHNDPAITSLLQGAAAKVLGPENVLLQPDPTLGTDDFGYYAALVPGCYYYIGVGNAVRNCTYPNHNPHFAVDPDALPLAAAVEVQAALDYLSED